MFKHPSIFQYCLENEAIYLRKQVDGMPPGGRRDELLRKASQIDIVTNIDKWLISSGLRAPT